MRVRKNERGREETGRRRRYGRERPAYATLEVQHACLRINKKHNRAGQDAAPKTISAECVRRTPVEFPYEANRGYKREFCWKQHLLRIVSFEWANDGEIEPLFVCAGVSFAVVTPSLQRSSYPVWDRLRPATGHTVVEKSQQQHHFQEARGYVLEVVQLHCLSDSS